jgi:hypothetical protein
MAGKASQATAQAFDALATHFNYRANLNALLGNHERRKEEWRFQMDMATKELEQIARQILAAEIRHDIAQRELENHDIQIANAQATSALMQSKFTNQALYGWMISQIAPIYFTSYQLAYDLAKRAEQAYRHELGLSESSFIGYGYWDNLKQGLLSGEKLASDLRRLEAAYLDENKREFELTKHVSLAMLDPIALLKLQTEGECYFSLPEAIFDLDFPGHYLRRIKSVSLTLPCVTGPYTGVSANLTLLGNRIRRETGAAGGYAYTCLEDSRFQHNVGAIQSIAISGAQQDSGLFELNFRDERYLPFEGSGTISDWRLKLTSAVRTFDWLTITDAVLHIRYTARDGGDLLGDAALQSLTAELAGIPLRRAFSARHEFPTEWNAFLRPAQGAGEAVLKLDLSEKRFPYFAQNAGLKISELQLIALVKDPGSWTDADVTVATGGDSIEVTLASAEEAYDGNPSGVIEYQGASPGGWAITVDTSTLGAPTGWVDDVIAIATYQITLPE